MQKIGEGYNIYINRWGANRIGTSFGREIILYYFITKRLIIN